MIENYPIFEIAAKLRDGFAVKGAGVRIAQPAPTNQRPKQNSRRDFFLENQTGKIAARKTPLRRPGGILPLIDRLGPPWQADSPAAAAAG